MKENYSVSAQNKIIQFPVSRSFSWVATAIVAFLCTLFASVLIRTIPIFGNMFRQLEVEVPWPTRLLLATYYWLLPVCFIALAIFVIWKECSAREPRRKLLLTARVFFTALITAGFVIFLLYLPVLTLASKLVGTK